ncbi:MAG: TetR/AcrR family transcriptional regulator [Steroidobacteraceae bacterium]|jgi:AcrR family transcriptional regulator
MSRKAATPADTGTADKVLAAASRLFYVNGIRAVGMDRIVAESGVAKTSLYRHFDTKDALVAAFLEREDREFWQQWDGVVAAAPADPKVRLMRILDWIGKRVSREGYRGCPQINVAAEFADPEHPARRIRRRHKAAMVERLKSIVAQIKVSRPGEVAVQLALLIDGAFTSDGRLSKADAVRILQNGADALLRDGSLKRNGSRAAKHGVGQEHR